MDTAQIPDTLIVFAHPGFEKSRVHRTWLPEVEALPFVAVRDLCQLYPGGVVDVKAEQAALESARTIVLQFPLYWYACPGILKEWIDQVFEHGWAYGQTGTALRGKRLLVATSAGGAREAYQAQGRNRHSIKQYLLPHEGLARLCGMEWLGVFALHGALTVQHKQDAQASAIAYAKLLTGLHDNSLDLASLQSLENLLEAIQAT
ncbi:MAG: NAD(P)H-dependent oxidoreductase [Fibrobacteres bacterium]|nr:NAD(P)H-dependent oxidoreductase [Fibrobacterota bacterium]